MASLLIGLLNANGLVRHRLELHNFLTQQRIDIMLISETHFTKTRLVKIPNFTI